MNRRKLVWIVLVAAAVAIGGTAAPYALDGNVRYHRLQYRFADAVLLPTAQWLAYSPRASACPFGIKVLALFRAADQKDLHQQRLVELGALTFCRFEFKNISQESRESDHLWRTCYSDAAPRCDALTFWDCTPVRIALWCDPANREAWKQFVAKYDVPNYWEVRDLSVVPTGPLKN